MRRFVRNLFARLPNTSRPSTRRARPALELLEARDLPSVTSTLYAISAEALSGDFANSVTAAKAQSPLRMAPMMLTNAVGTLPKGDVDVLRVQLAAGQSLMVDLNAPSGSKITMQALDPNGNAVPGQAALTDGGLPALAFTASQAGDYFIQLNNAPNTGSLGLYTVSLEETGLADSLYDSGTIAKTFLQNGDGHTYVSLTGNVLNITGSTGYGFGLQGNWTQGTIPTAQGVESIYQATSVSLQTAVGLLPIPLPKNVSFEVITTPNPFGKYAGAVSSVGLNVGQVNVPFALNSASLIGPLTQQYGLNAVLPNLPISFGVGLGSDLKGLGAPLDSAVPYLYAHVTTGLTLNLGHAQIKAGTGGGGYGLDVVIDPSDPMMYLHVSGLPAVDDVAVGLSKHGLIPFVPENQPQQWKGSLFGQVFTHADLDIAAITNNEVPLSFNGDLLLNLDKVGAPAWTTNGPVSQLLKGNVSSALGQLKNVSFGVNGGLDLAISGQSSGFSLSLPVLEGTAVYDSPSQTVYFHGSEKSFFLNVPGIEKTPLKFLADDPATIDGAFGPKITTVTVAGTDAVANWSATFDAQAISATFGVNVPGLGQLLTLNGKFYYTKKFSFTGTLGLPSNKVPSWLSAGAISFTADNNGITGSLSAQLLGGILSGRKFNLSGGVNADFSFNWSWTYSFILPIVKVPVTVSVGLSSANGFTMTVTYDTDSHHRYIATVEADGTEVVSCLKDGVAYATRTYDKAGNVISSTETTITQTAQNVIDDLRSWL